MKRLKLILKNIPFISTASEIIRTNFIAVYKSYGLKDCILHNINLTRTYLKYYLNRKSYKIISDKELLKLRTSDKVFIFGSGYSLTQLNDDEWRHFEEHNTVGFSGFIYQKWVRTDYHLIRGWMESKRGTRTFSHRTNRKSSTLDK